MWYLMREFAPVSASLIAGLGEWSMPAATVSSEAARRGILVCDTDDPSMHLVARTLAAEGYDCVVCPGQEALGGALEHESADALVAGVKSHADGLDLLRWMRGRRPEVPVILLTPGPDVPSAVDAMREGAFDYLGKPPAADHLTKVVGRAVEMGSLRRENRRLRQQLDVASTTAGFIGESPQSKNLVALIRRVAPARSTALVEGESGTGKELVARMMHYWSARAAGPFVAVNCKAFASGVVESELFGHEKGSFTGAIAARAGCFERASGGTLFLDEIAEAGTDFQAKLLRVLEDGEVLRVGASKSRRVDVRIVAATNRVLRNEVASGSFRADLYFRLNVIPLRIAPLRERRDDILALARHFLAFHAAEAARPITLSPSAERALLDYPWPGNVRELENAIERAVVMSGAEVLRPEAFALDGPEQAGAGREAASVACPDAGENLQAYLDRAAITRIRVALESVGGNRAAAATSLGVDRTTLYRLMKRLGI